MTKVASMENGMGKFIYKHYDAVILNLLILRDKTMGEKLIYISNDTKQN